MKYFYETILLGFGVASVYGVSLNYDPNKEQIFVQGNWYNKDGTTNKLLDEPITPHAIFQQCQHHENATGCNINTMWAQRYWVRNDFYRPGGPVFIELAGEWDAAGDINSGIWRQYAADHGAMMIVLEHRFYGDSFPVQNPTVNDLWLMTSQQALADAARFIEIYKEQNNLGGANWAAFGCSYGANLVAWFKLKYPNHVKTAVSSSGPIEAIYDFPGYVQTCSEVIQTVASDCHEKLYDTFTCMEGLVNGSSPSCLTYTTPNDLKTPLNYCYSVDWNGRGKQLFFNYLAFPGWATNAPSAHIRTSCALYQQQAGSDKIVKYGNFVADRGQNGGCRSGDKTLQQELQEEIDFLKTKEAWQTGAAAWKWQTCNEMGYYMSSDPVHGTFGRNTWTGDVYAASCATNYGSMYTRAYIEGRIAATNAYYGGKNIQSKCVIFVHGTWDPWHLQGRLTPLNGNTVIVVPGTEHCADLSNPVNADMAAAQAAINAQIGTYFADPNC